MNDQVQPIPPYESAHTRAAWSTYLLAACLVLNIVALGSGYMQVNLLTQVKDGVQITMEQAESNDLRMSIIAIVNLALMLATAIVFLTWVYRAHKNLGALGVRDTRFTPGWAVGWFFIPFLNLVRPYQILTEIRAASDPEIVDPMRWNEHKAGGVVIGWWALWLLAGVAARLSVEGSDLDEYIMATWAGMVSDLLAIGSAAFAIMMVRDIDNRQSAKKDRLGVLEGVPPLPNSDSGVSS
jgi:hypothetical protein